MDNRIAVVAALAGVMILGGILFLGLSRGAPPASERAAAPLEAERKVTKFRAAPSAAPEVGAPGTEGAGAGAGAPPGGSEASGAGPGSREDGAAPEGAEGSDQRELETFPIDRDGLRDAVASQQAELKACYDTLLESYPDVAGRMSVSFVIDPDGRVSSADIAEASFDSLYMEGCIVTAMEDLRFEHPGGGGDVSVTYPFIFDNEG